MKRNRVFSVIFILCLLLAASVFGGVRAQDQNSLQLQGVTWTNPTITVQIVPQENASWWKPYNINSTLRAIGEWNNAIVDFVANYSDFAYLSTVNLVPVVSHNTNLKYDVTIFWKENQIRPMEDDLGVTTTIATTLGCGTITNCTIILATTDENNNALNEVDVQNVALHEIGHSLGLSHSNYTGDLMYPTYALGSPLRAISTLDVYAVAAVFEWLQGPKRSSVNLPSNIEYQYFTISTENLPPPQSSLVPIVNTVQTVLNGVFQFVMRPEFLVFVLLVAVGLLSATLLYTTRRRRQEKRAQNN